MSLQKLEAANSSGCSARPLGWGSSFHGRSGERQRGLVRKKNKNKMKNNIYFQQLSYPIITLTLNDGGINRNDCPHPLPIVRGRKRSPSFFFQNSGSNYFSNLSAPFPERATLTGPKKHTLSCSASCPPFPPPPPPPRVSVGQPSNAAVSRHLRRMHSGISAARAGWQQLAALLPGMLVFAERSRWGGQWNPGFAPASPPVSVWIIRGRKY